MKTKTLDADTVVIAGLSTFLCLASVYSTLQTTPIVFVYVFHQRRIRGRKCSWKFNYHFLSQSHTKIYKENRRRRRWRWRISREIKQRKNRLGTESGADFTCIISFIFDLFFSWCYCCWSFVLFLFGRRCRSNAKRMERAKEIEMQFVCACDQMHDGVNHLIGAAFRARREHTAWHARTACRGKMYLYFSFVFSFVFITFRNCFYFDVWWRESGQINVCNEKSHTKKWSEWDCKHLHKMRWQQRSIAAWKMKRAISWPLICAFLLLSACLRLTISNSVAFYAQTRVARTINRGHTVFRVPSCLLLSFVVDDVGTAIDTTMKIIVREIWFCFTVLHTPFEFFDIKFIRSIDCFPNNKSWKSSTESISLHVCV